MKRSISISGDGQHIIVGFSGGRLYSSADAGENWSEEQPAGNFDRAWSTTTVNREQGSIYLAAISNGRMYLSGTPYFPDIDTETFLSVRSALYAKMKKVDPTIAPLICGPVGCHPEVLMKLSEYPVVQLSIIPSVVVALNINERPAAEIICRMS